MYPYVGRAGSSGVEQLTFNQWVVGSIPTRLTIFPNMEVRDGCLRLVLVLATLSLPVSTPAQVGETFTASVTHVTDGDTISVVRRGTTVRIRLDGIDTPETDQPFGTEAAAFTAARVLQQEVTITVRDVDRYGRLVSRVLIAGVDVSVALVTAGLAWHYVRYSDDPVLARAEADARAAKIGLWHQTSPAPPWEFRQRSRNR